MRVLLLSIALAVCATTVPIAAQARIQPYQLNIPRQPLDGALKDFAQQTGLQIARFAEASDDGAIVGPVAGQLSAEQALTSLLAPSGLTYRVINERTIAIGRPQVVAEDAESAGGASPSASLEEVTITAQKRGAERLQDVPLPVSALSAESLAGNGQLLLRDYYTRVPGLNVAPSQFGTQDLSLRGLAQAGGNATTSVMIDEVPIGGSTSRVGGTRVPDIDPGDLDRIEVLRGPQGTIYGASSLGGLLKFVTKDPSPEKFSSRVEAGLSDVQNGREPGFNVRASGNVPITDSLAIRVSGFTREDPGYIDNPVLDRQGVNEAHAYGGRLSALWRPSDVFSIKLSALYQHTRADAMSVAYARPGLGDLQQNDIPGVGAIDHTDQAFSAVLKATLGNAELTSVTGYNSFRDNSNLDFTFAVPEAETVKAFGVTDTALFSHFPNDKFFQEVRVSVPVGRRVEWLAGAVYVHENGSFFEDMYARDHVTGQVAGQWWRGVYPVRFEEYAAFTNFTFEVTDRVDVQIGGRRSHSKEEQGTAVQTGPFTSVFQHQPSPNITPGVSAQGDSFTYLVTPRFKVSADLMVYTRIASGYRPGGANNAFGAPPQYKADKTQNYEVGIKGSFLDHALFVDASLYHIDWKDLQINLLTPENFVYGGNGGKAKSEGVELAIESKPLAGLTLALSAAFNNAELTQDFPAGSSVYGVKGDRLPNSTRFSGSVSAQQSFPLTVDAFGFVGGTLSYVGDRRGGYTDAATPRDVFPSYTRADLSAGVGYRDWKFNLYLNNVTDERGVIAAGVGKIPADSVYFITPRTLGLNISRDF